MKNFEVAFTRIYTLENLHYCTNLQELTLIETGKLESFKGIEKIAHSLERLRLIGCGLTRIDEAISSLYNLRELTLGDNSISVLENLGGCYQLEKLWIYSNHITRIQNLENNTRLKMLWIQDNQISNLDSLETLINLQELYISGNPLCTFHDIKGISRLAILERIAFDCGAFEPCPVSELPGYREFVLTTVNSQFLKLFDGQAVYPETREAARQDYLQESLRVQERISYIEQEHKAILMNLDSKNRENEEQLKYIERMLVDDLHGLKSVIDSGRTQLIKENERLENLHSRSEEILKTELSKLQNKYLKEVDKIYRDQRESVDREAGIYKDAIRVLEFEQEVAICLIDILYDTEGRVIYNELPNTHNEYKFLENILKVKLVDDPSLEVFLRKAYQVANLLQASPGLSAQFYFATTAIQNLKSVLCDSSFSQSLNFATSPMKCLSSAAGPYLLLMSRVHYGSDSGDEEESMNMGKMIYEYVLVVEVNPNNSSEIFTSITDERLYSLLSCYTVSYMQDLPNSSLESLRTIEKEALEKYNDHIRRVWGDIDNSAVEKIKEQDEDISSMLTLADSLKSQIESEKQAQLQLLKELRISIRETPNP